MTATTLIACDGETVEVECLHAAGGLAITKSSPPSMPGFVVTHEHSGQAVRWIWDNLGDCRRFFDLLLRIGIDWRVPVEALGPQNLRTRIALVSNALDGCPRTLIRSREPGSWCGRCGDSVLPVAGVVVPGECPLHGTHDHRADWEVDEDAELEPDETEEGSHV